MILITSARSLMVISMSIFLVSTISCKPADSGSDLKTLDNFAAGSRVSLNECVGDPKTRNGKARDSKTAVAENLIQKSWN